jgi:4-hydroxythreonine-4-phosphate dehydrogenase
MLAQLPRHYELVVVADPELMRERARLLGMPLKVHEFDPSQAPRRQDAGEISILACTLARPSECGRLDPLNAPYVLKTLDQAVAGCQQGLFDAMVTAPVQKSVINDSGIPFSGHTEYLAALTHTPTVVMMLATGSLRVALATTHLPLAQVPAAITRERLQTVIEVLHHSLQTHFSLPRPRIAVLGLNPHAGEGGHLGREEIDTINPLLQSLRDAGMQLLGPLPADTAFNPEQLAQCDAVLAMYHDQGLPVLKHAGFGEAVNITLGLPIIRTSVDHGTALDLAGTGRARSDSLQSAIECALQMSGCRQ